jgi:hypothetical protein
VAYTLQDDPAVALQAAATLYAERYQQVACAVGENEATVRVLETAEIFIAWLRRPVRFELELIQIEEQDTGAPVASPPTGGTVTTIDTSQQVRYAITARDDRGFEVDANFQVKVEPAGVVDAEIVEASTGTASGKDELLVKANATGPTSALVTVFDPANEATIFGSDSVDVIAGGVATVLLESPQVEEQPEPPPTPEPEPTPEPLP